MGVTTAYFQSSGNIPEVILWLMSLVSMLKACILLNFKFYAVLKVEYL